MKKTLLVGCLLLTGLWVTPMANAGDCCDGCCGGRGPMRRMMGMMVAVGTMGMVRPNARRSTVAVTNPTPETPDAEKEGAKEPPPPV